MDLLDDLGPRLRALTADQPTQPGDRVPGATARARRIRRTRAAVSVAAALAVLAPAGLLVSLSQRHDAGPQFARSDVLSWPDRSDPAEARVAEGAVQTYRVDHPQIAPTVTWLARRAVRMPNLKTAHVAVFLTTEGDQRALVVMTRRDDLPHGEGPITWGDVSRTLLEKGAEPDHVGLYLTYDRADGTPGFGNVSVLLADPRSRALSWREQPLTAAPRGEQEATSGSITSKDGTFVVDLGELTGPVEATVRASGSHETYPLSLTEYPTLIRPKLTAPSSWDQTGGGAFQTERAEEGWTGTQYSVFSTSDAVMVECYGGGRLQVAVTGGPKDAVLSSVRIPCDGLAHTVREQGQVPVQSGASLVVRPTQLQVIAFVTGRQD